MSPPPSSSLRVAAVLALVGLAFMMWSLIDPTPGPVVIALSVGQAIGTLSFLWYLAVVAKSLGLWKTSPPKE